MVIFGLNKEDGRMVFNTFKLNTRDRYLGSAIGMLWAIIHPLLLLGMYTFIFSFIFKSKLPGSEKSLTYVIWLISGFAPWMAISEGISAATNSVTSSVSLIKNIVFKTEILPIAAAFSGIFSMTIGLLLLMVLLVVEGTGLSLSILWLIVLIPLQIFFLIGLGFFLSTLNVFFRDLMHMLPTVLMLILFFTPVFYTIEQMPSIIRRVTFLNPFYQIVQSFRFVLIDKQLPDLTGILYVMALSLLLWLAGLKFFRRLKGYFECVL